MKKFAFLLSPPVHGGSAAVLSNSEGRGKGGAPSDRFATTSPVNGGGKEPHNV